VYIKLATTRVVNKVYHSDTGYRYVKIAQCFAQKLETIVRTCAHELEPRSPTKRTPAGPAIAFMKSHGLRVANDNPAMLERVGMDRVSLRRSML
jgi:hypothetical protein